MIWCETLEVSSGSLIERYHDYSIGHTKQQIALS